VQDRHVSFQSMVLRWRIQIVDLGRRFLENRRDDRWDSPARGHRRIQAVGSRSDKCSSLHPHSDSPVNSIARRQSNEMNLPCQGKGGGPFGEGGGGEGVLVLRGYHHYCLPVADQLGTIGTRTTFPTSRFTRPSYDENDPNFS